MNEINVRNEILDSINDLNQVTMESTFDVFGSMLNACEKANMITEYASDASELDMFAIFQEAEVSKDGEKNQSFGYKLIHFIPNLIKKLIAVIKSAWSGTKTPEKPSTGLIGLLEKVKGKSAEWIKEHPTEIGVSAAVAAALATFVAFQNSEKLKDILNKWAKGLKAFYVAAKNSPTIAFEGGSVITNIKTDGLIKSLDKLRDVLKRTTVITKDIAEKKKSIKEIDSELKDIIAKAEEVRKDPNALTGESITSNINDFIDLLEKVKGSMESFTELESVDIAAIAKPMSEENSNEQSYVASVNNNAGILSKIANAAAVAWAATSTAAISFIKWIGEGLGIIKKAEATNDTSEASVNMENQSKGEEKSEESKEESSSTEIKDAKTAEAVEAVKGEPSKENATAAIEAIKENISKTDTGGDSAKSNATVAIKDGLDKVGAYLAKQPEISQQEADKIGALALTIDTLSEALSSQKLDKAAIQKYVDKAKKAEQSVLNVSPMKTKNGEKVVRNTQRGSNIVTGAELMDICKQLPNNPVVKINEDSIVLKTKKGKELERTGNISIPGLSKLGYGKKNYVHKSGNGNTWIIESADDIFDVFNIYVESVLMSCAEDAEDTSFVVEYADGEVETVSQVIFESYDEPVETMEESINNHWYR